MVAENWVRREDFLFRLRRESMDAGADFIRFGRENLRPFRDGTFSGDDSWGTDAEDGNAVTGCESRFDLR